MKEYFYSASYVRPDGKFRFSGVILAENGFDAYDQVETIIEYEINIKYKTSDMLRNELFDESNVHVSCLNLV